MLLVSRKRSQVMYFVFHPNSVVLAMILPFIENEQIASKSILNLQWRKDCLQSHLKNLSFIT